MDVSELRSAFSLSQSVAEKARGFRSARLEKILANDAPVPISTAGKLVLHVMAASAFDDATGAGVVPTAAQRSMFAPIGWVQGSSHLNFDGYVSYYGYGTPTVSYTQQFRSGIVESMLAFEKFSNENDFYLSPEWYEIRLIQNVESYITALEELGSSSPYFVFLSFLGISDYRFLTSSTGNFPTRRLDRDNLILPTVTIEDKQHVNSSMRALFDMVWNAFGLEKSKYFNDASQWIGPPISL